MLNLDLHTYNDGFIDSREIDVYSDRKTNIKERFLNGDLAHWLSIDSYIKSDELQRIKRLANEIRNNSDVLVVIGIGGSYMGSRAIIEALSPMYDREKPEIIFMGKNVNPNEYVETLEYIKDKNIAVNVISKSGTTLEPSIAFDLVMEVMKDKYDEKELRNRVIVTTDSDSGTLRELVDEKGYNSFVVPTDIGGRYSVFTPVGLFPIAVSGIDVEQLLIGVKEAMNSDLDLAIDYAVVRDVLYNKNKMVEAFTVYDEHLSYFGEWLKQLFAESHGKEKRGILPILNINTRDLHSMGQFLQEGNDIIFETVIGIKNNSSLFINKYGMDLNDINNMIIEKVCEAHRHGHTPSSVLWMERLDAKNLGELMQFFMLATISGGILLEVNPFDQPGVQEYKNLVNRELER